MKEKITIKTTAVPDTTSCFVTRATTVAAGISMYFSYEGLRVTEEQWPSIEDYILFPIIRLKDLRKTKCLRLLVVK